MSNYSINSWNNISRCIVAYTFKNIFDYQPGDVYWCTADIGWITGHSYTFTGLC